MKSICAWCLKDLGTVDENGPLGLETSHGICPECRNNLQFQKGVSLQEYMDSFSMPIFVVDNNVKVAFVNSAACTILGKTPEKIVQHLGGDVFECAHARSPEGCGKTIHCSGCAIRKTITQCFTTGKPQLKVPAFVNPGGPLSVALTITTIKVGDLVMLRIDRLA